MQRLYPSYTTKQLKEIVAVGNLSDDMTAQMNAEIAAREAGISNVRVTPQIEKAYNPMRDTYGQSVCVSDDCFGLGE